METPNVDIQPAKIGRATLTQKQVKDAILAYVAAGRPELANHTLNSVTFDVAEGQLAGAKVLMVAVEQQGS